MVEQSRRRRIPRGTGTSAPISKTFRTPQNICEQELESRAPHLPCRHGRAILANEATSIVEFDESIGNIVAEIKATT
jgi:hypothetical protein